MRPRSPARGTDEDVVLVLDVYALDSGSRSAKVIWTACLLGAALAVGVDLGLRPKLPSIATPSHTRTTHQAHGASLEPVGRVVLGVAWWS